MLYLYVPNRQDALCDDSRIREAEIELRKRGINVLKASGLQYVKKNLKGNHNDYLFMPYGFTYDLYDVIEYCNNTSIPVLTIHSYPDYFPDCVYNTVARDYYRCMRMVLAYCIHKKSNPKIAFFGPAVNPFEDRRKISSLYSLYSEFNQEDVFFNIAGFENCFENFFEKRYNYDTVLCPNGYMALAFTKCIYERDPEYAKRLFIISLAEIKLLRLYHISVTSTTYYDSSIYDSFVLSYKMISRSKHILSMNVTLENEILIRESTGGFPLPPKSSINDLVEPYSSPNRSFVFPKGEQADAVKYVKDSPLKDIVAIDNMLNIIDLVDFKIILMFLVGAKNQEISEYIFSSIQTVQYRSRKMFEMLGVSKKNEFISLISKYIQKEKLEKYIQELENEIFKL